MPEQVNTNTIELEPQAMLSLDENMALMAVRLERLESEAQDIAGTNTYPRWWYEGTDAPRAVKQQLQDPNLDPKYISEYFQLNQKNQKLRSMTKGCEDDASPLFLTVYEIGIAAVARGFKNEGSDGPMHAALINQLSKPEDTIYDVTDELEILREVYGTGSLTGLFGIGGEAYADALKPLLRTKAVVGHIRYAEEGLHDADTVEERRTKTNKWMARALTAATNIDEAEAANYTFGASRLGQDRNIIRVLDKFDRFGVDRLRAVSQFTGIHAFEMYSDSQLELMERLLTDPESAAEYLSHHDVTVVMINRFGDYSGVLDTAADTFGDEANRTLVFEITYMSDILRYMLMLRDAGVQASTLALAAHAASGQFYVSDLRELAHTREDIATIAGKGLVHLVNSGKNLGEGVFSYSMHQMKGVARMVEELMQPSRAIDDPEEDAGRKKVIFQACNAATEADMKDVDDNNDKITIGQESLASQLGKDLLANGVTSKIDIYGAPGGIQLYKTERGARFTKRPLLRGGDRQPQHAIRVRVENGTVSQQQVDEIALRKIT